MTLSGYRRLWAFDFRELIICGCVIILKLARDFLLCTKKETSTAIKYGYILIMFYFLDLIVNECVYPSKSMYEYMAYRPFTLTLALLVCFVMATRSLCDILN